MLENEIRDEMVRLLRYANRQKVGAALGVSRASVSDWAAGRHITPARLAQVRALFDAPDTTKEPPPEWARALEQRLTETILANRETVMLTLAELTARYGVERALASQPPDEPAPDKQGPRRARAGRR